MNEGSTRALLRALNGGQENGFLHLHDTLADVSGRQGFDLTDRLEFSVKFKPGQFSFRRFDGPIQAVGEDSNGLRVGLLETLAACAPSGGLKRLLQDENGRVAQWLQARQRTAAYVANDFDQGVFKTYLFQSAQTADLDGQNLWHIAERLPELSYIDCQEFLIDAPDRSLNSVYFNLQRVPLGQLFSHQHHPHTQLRRKLLDRIEAASTVFASLQRLVAGIKPLRRPVIKLRSIPIDGALGENVERLRNTEYCVSSTLHDRSRKVSISQCIPEMDEIAATFDCVELYRSWLEIVTPFAPFLSHFAVGQSDVTLYYKLLGTGKNTTGV